MKKVCLLTILTALPVEVWAASKVEEVVVFADRAKVKRVAPASCQGGTAAARFEPLPMSLDVRTLRGEGRDVIGVTSQVVTDQEPVDARARELKAEREKLGREIEAKNAEVANAQQRVSRVGQYGGVFAEVMDEAVRDPKPNVATWNRTFDVFRNQRLALSEEIAKLRIEARALQRTARKLDKQIARLGTGAAHQWRRAEVTVACKQPGKVQVELTYVLPGAEWRPEYDLDFKPSRGKVGPGTARLTVAAVVRQSTGEDWSNVRLRLSTAKPKLGSEAPYPAALWLSAQKRETGKVLVQGQERRNELQAGGAAGQTTPQGVELDDGGQAVVLKIPHRVNVVADGRPYWVPVDVINTKATAQLVTIPKLRPYVYRLVSLKNPARYPLLEGRIHGFRSGSYVGDTHLTYKGAGEPMEISIGIDEELSVERKTLTHRDRGASFLSSTKHMARAFRITVRNRSRGREKVEVRENIPVSKIEDVSVEMIGKGTTKGYAKDERRGLLKWHLDLPRGAEKEVDLAYEIHLPDDWKVR